jgi:hypothetical protein
MKTNVSIRTCIQTAEKIKNNQHMIRMEYLQKQKAGKQSNSNLLKKKKDHTLNSRLSGIMVGMEITINRKPG